MGFHKQHTNIISIQVIKQNTTSILEFPLKTLSSYYPVSNKDIHYSDFHLSLILPSFVLNISNIKCTLLYLVPYIRFINTVACNCMSLILTAIWHFNT